MAIIRFSTLTNNQTIAFNPTSFNPGSDVLLFDSASISAGGVNFKRCQ